METLMESIQHKVHLFDPKYLDHLFNLVRKVEIKNMFTNNYTKHYPSHKLIQPTRIAPQKMDERRSKCYV